MHVYVCVQARERERGWRRKGVGWGKNKILPLAGSLSKSLQNSGGPGQSQELYLDLPCRRQESKHQGHHLMPSITYVTLVRSYKESRSKRMQVCWAVT